MASRVVPSDAESSNVDDHAAATRIQTAFRAKATRVRYSIVITARKFGQLGAVYDKPERKTLFGDVHGASANYITRKELESAKVALFVVVPFVAAILLLLQGKRIFEEAFSIRYFNSTTLDQVNNNETVLPDNLAFSEYVVSLLLCRWGIFGIQTFMYGRNKDAGLVYTFFFPALLDAALWYALSLIAPYSYKLHVLWIFFFISYAGRVAKYAVARSPLGNWVFFSSKKTYMRYLQKTLTIRSIVFKRPFVTVALASIMCTLNVIYWYEIEILTRFDNTGRGLFLIIAVAWPILEFLAKKLCLAALTHSAKKEARAVSWSGGFHARNDKYKYHDIGYRMLTIALDLPGYVSLLILSGSTFHGGVAVNAVFDIAACAVLVLRHTERGIDMQNQVSEHVLGGVSIQGIGRLMKQSTTVELGIETEVDNKRRKFAIKMANEGYATKIAALASGPVYHFLMSGSGSGYSLSPQDALKWIELICVEILVDVIKKLMARTVYVQYRDVVIKFGEQVACIFCIFFTMMSLQTGLYIGLESGTGV